MTGLATAIVFLTLTIAGVGWVVAWDRERRLRGITRTLRRIAPSDNSRDSASAISGAFQRLRNQIITLESENRRLQTILAALDDAVIVVGARQEILSVNDAALELFPTSFATVRGRTVIEMTGDHEIAELVRQCQLTRLRQERTIELSGSNRIARIVALRTDEPDSDVLLVARDVTQVQHLQAVRRELVANVSHELRTPLASIKLYVETMLDGGLEVPGMAEDRLNKINREVDELTQLVRELLELSRLESGRDQPTLVSIHPAELARSAVERLEAQAERAGIVLSLAVPRDVSRILGDRRMLEGALVNLIHNAVKFTSAGGNITVGASRDGQERVSLWVEDTGVGIAPEHLPRLFERFYKEDPARSGSGTGLGLAIVKHVALVHNGTVAVQSMPGRGSRFTITVPAIADTRAAEPAA